MQILQPPTDAHHRYQTTVEGVALVVEWHFVERSQSWYLSLFDTDGDAIARGYKLVPGTNPFVRMKDERLPAGAWYVSSPDDPIGRDAFTDATAQLVHFSPAEVAELTAGLPVSGVVFTEP